MQVSQTFFTQNQGEEKLLTESVVEPAPKKVKIDESNDLSETEVFQNKFAIINKYVFYFGATT